jgi:hypothetical protein
LVGVKLVGHFKKLWKYLLNEEYENHFLSAWAAVDIWITCRHGEHGQISGLWTQSVPIEVTDVLEERTASIYRVEE